MQLPSTAKDAATFLACHSTYQNINQWASGANLNDTADAYYEIRNVSTTKAACRDFYRTACWAEQCRIHEILNRSGRQLRRLTDHDVRILSSSYNVLEKPSVIFIRALMELPPKVVDKLRRRTKKKARGKAKQRDSKQGVRTSARATVCRAKERPKLRKGVRRSGRLRRTSMHSISLPLRTNPKLKKPSEKLSEGQNVAKVYDEARSEEQSIETLPSQPAGKPEATPLRRSLRVSVSRTGKRSEYFSSVVEESTSKTPKSCNPFPPLESRAFGLIQEQVADDLFQMLIAVNLLNKTKGRVALPAFWKLMADYPTPETLAIADPKDVLHVICHLGLQNQRTAKLIGLAQVWLQDPPQRGRRHRTLHYPDKNAGYGIRPNEILDDDDAREGAWEIAHLPGVGDYAIDSFRIFCRDRIRKLAEGYNAEGAACDFEPEWKRVIPRDKELRGILKWMWLREDGIGTH